MAFPAHKPVSSDQAQESFLIPSFVNDKFVVCCLLYVCLQSLNIAPHFSIECQPVPTTWDYAKHMQAFLRNSCSYCTLCAQGWDPIGELEAHKGRTVRKS